MSKGKFMAFYATLVGTTETMNLVNDPALALAIQRREEDRNNIRVAGLVNLLEALEIVREKRVNTRVVARHRLNDAQESIKTFHRAVDFFNETGNPFPLLKEIGCFGHDYLKYLPNDMLSKFNALPENERTKLQTIPPEWSPKSSIVDPEVTAE
jgi:hypothetical protein